MLGAHLTGEGAGRRNDRLVLVDDLQKIVVLALHFENDIFVRSGFHFG